ncbi:hypothetical protein RJT34_25939 [Clitoria ternatea]|uniref:Uncharacterized protein n=1 Tax=Clitoria ternatea TaxID=43366 RepID=A0AAN9FF01_CLITE
MLQIGISNCYHPFPDDHAFAHYLFMHDYKLTMLLRIVYPGGHIELHDRPVTAAEIMCRNPRCCVAYPYVFQQPWAVVEPDAVLMLGEKFYVVPISTIRKLQKLSPRNSPSPAREITISPSAYEIRETKLIKEEEDDVVHSTCCVFRNKSTAKQTSNHKQRPKNKRERFEIRPEVINLSPNVNHNKNDGNAQTRKRAQDLAGNRLRGSPKKAWSSEYWQPSLESITEE